MGAFATGFDASFDAAAASPSTARDVIVKALERLPELNVSSTSPVTPTAFCAWPKWALTTYVGSGGLSNPSAHEFDVLVLLPNSYEPDTTAHGDDLLPRLIAVLWSVGTITTAQPTTVLFDQAQAMPALQIRVIPRIC